MRATTLAVGLISAAARSPAINPRYSATLLVAMPKYSARSAKIVPVRASLTIAPKPAGPGFPREPPSASTMSLSGVLVALTGPTPQFAPGFAHIHRSAGPHLVPQPRFEPVPAR